MSVDYLASFSGLLQGHGAGATGPAELDNVFGQCKFSTSVTRPGSGGASLFLDYNPAAADTQGDLPFAGRITTTKKYRRVKFWYRCNDPGTGFADTVWLFQWTAGKVGLRVEGVASPSLVLFQDVTPWGGTNLAMGTEYIIELLWYDDPVSPKAEIYVDGVLRLTRTSAAFNQGTSESSLHFGQLIGKGIQERYAIYMADLWAQAADAEADLIPTPLPFSKLDLPNADGSYTEWDSSGGGAGVYTNWDEVPNNVDTDFNESGTGLALERQLANFQSCADLGLGTNDIIQAVIVKCIAKVTAGTNGQPAILARDNGADFTTLLVPSGGYTDGSYDRFDAVMPSGGAAWTQARVDAFQAGMQRDTGASAMRNLRATGIYVILLYTNVRSLIIPRAPLRALIGR